MTFALALVLATAPAAAPNQVTLRPAEQVLADYARAIGGAEAWKRIKTVHAKRTLTIKGQGASGRDEHWGTADGRYLNVSTLDGVGSFRQGSDGRVFWSQDPLFGLRKLSGAEQEEARIAARWNAEPNLASLYAKVTSVPAPSPAPVQAPVECVELSKKEGKPAILCFDAGTHLRAFQTGTQPSPGGEIPYTIVFRDWRQVRGIKTWYGEDMTAGPSTIESKISELTFDEKVSPSLFKMPKP